MTMTLERTGSTLGDYEELASFQDQLVSRHTPARNVSDHDLQKVLTQFDIALAEPMAPLLLFVVARADSTGTSISDVGRGVVATSVGEPLAEAMHRTLLLLHVVATPAPAVEVASEELPFSAEPPGLTSGAEDVVAAIKSLSWRLGLPLRDICNAANVSRSAYYTWSQPDAPRPRVASQGRLWALAQFTEDLEDLLDAPPGQWLLARPDRRAQLIDGRFDDLLESLRAQPRPLRAAPDYARFLSVGGDCLASDAELTTHHREFRKPTSAQTVSPSRRRKK
jgi:hypothetical protein